MTFHICNSSAISSLPVHVDSTFVFKLNRLVLIRQMHALTLDSHLNIVSPNQARACCWLINSTLMCMCFATIVAAEAAEAVCLFWKMFDV